MSLDDVPFLLPLPDACAIIVSESKEQDSILARAINPDTADWTLTNLLLRKVAHSIDVGNWIAAGGKKAGRYPKAIPLPGEEESTTQKENLADGEGVDIDEIEQRLASKYG